MNEQAQGFFARKHAENSALGYRVDYKFLGVAFFIEAAVVGTSLAGAWLFATAYGRDQRTIAMMMLAPIAYAGVELSRVPLAFAMRVQPSKFWKVIFATMVLCAAGVTVKSLSQLGEIMFRPRLTEVTEATISLREARGAQGSVAATITAADAVVEQRREELRSADERLKLAGTALAEAKDDCSTAVRRTDNGTVRFRQCRSDSRRPALTGSLDSAQAARERASGNLDRATGDRAKLSVADVAHRVGEAEKVQRIAVMNSQLHSFTGMFFGKDPTEVTEGEIHFFLRWFVFFPAIFASLAATALAMASVTYPKRDAAAAAVEIDEAVLRNYVLDPLVDEVERRLHQRMDVSAAQAEVAEAPHDHVGSRVEEAPRPPSSVNDNPRLKVVGEMP